MKKNPTFVQASFISFATACRSEREEEKDFVRSIRGMERKEGASVVVERRDWRYCCASRAASRELWIPPVWGGLATAAILQSKFDCLPDEGQKIEWILEKYMESLSLSSDMQRWGKGSRRPPLPAVSF